MNSDLRDLPHDVDSVATRLQRLELQNERLALQVRRMKAALTLVVALAGLGLTWSLIPANEAVGQAAGAPKMIRATGFVIVDKTGAERGSLSFNDADGVAGITLEPSKDARVSLSASKDSVGIRISHGKNDINLGCTPKAGTYLEMFDKDGKSVFEQRKP
jgi:hypothetical protein